MRGGHKITEEVPEVLFVCVHNAGRPIFPGKRYEDWELEDPEGRSLGEVRHIRDDLEGRVTRLLTDLAPDRPVTSE